MPVGRLDHLFVLLWGQFLRGNAFLRRHGLQFVDLLLSLDLDLGSRHGSSLAHAFVGTFLDNLQEMLLLRGPIHFLGDFECLPQNGRGIVRQGSDGIPHLSLLWGDHASRECFPLDPGGILVVLEELCLCRLLHGGHIEHFGQDRGSFGNVPGNLPRQFAGLHPDIPKLAERTPRTLHAGMHSTHQNGLNGEVIPPWNLPRQRRAADSTTGYPGSEVLDGIHREFAHCLGSGLLGGIQTDISECLVQGILRGLLCRRTFRDPHLRVSSSLLIHCAGHD